MSRAALPEWQIANQRYLEAAIAALRMRLESGERDGPSPAASRLDELAAAMSAPPAIETLAHAFSLSPFERDLLLLCSGVELDAGCAAACARARGSAASDGRASFGLALATLPGGHWSALTPDGPLRRWRLLEPLDGERLSSSPLRVDERVLHYIAGVQYLDERLAPLVTPLEAEPSGRLSASQQRLAERVAQAWMPTPTGLPEPLAPAIVQLTGSARATKRAVVAEVCARLGLGAWLMHASDVPAGAEERDELARRWEREAVLGGAVLLLDADGLSRAEPGRFDALGRLLERIASPLVVAVADRLPVDGRDVMAFPVEPPSLAEQRAAWASALGPAAARLNGQLDRIVDQFSLSEAEIRSAARELGEPADPPDDAQVSRRLWDVCRARTRPRIDHLAQRIEAVATWDDLVLPRNQQQLLADIAVHVRQRARVYRDWGFASKSGRGLGISALFAGASGTGKTMAAEVLANELRLDLYRIDLSQVVSKYIGETEKNLGQLFDAAEGGGVILLFDEADALFGKRSEVRDSHDRYANIEVSYLLQRMEAYDGLAILTTNLRSALDPAFLRRIRFVVSFPFPSPEQRAAIWARVFPATTPTDGLDAERLAKLSVTGGNIRSIALNAAFLAADAGEPVRMAHLLQAARAEHVKLERPLPEAETRGWT